MTAPVSPRVLLGHLVRSHGLRGAIRLRPTSGRAAETAEALKRIKVIFLDEESRELMRVRPERDEILLEIRDVTDRDQADALRGRAVFVERGALPPPSAEEVYLADLVGCEVIDTVGAHVGVVEGSYNAGGHETLMVRNGDKEHLLPFVDAMVVSVDLEARRIVYDPPPGLLDLDEAESG